MNRYSILNLNESPLEAIRREIGEEIGSEFRIVRSIVCAENFFDLDAMHFHAACIFYLVECPGDGHTHKTTPVEIRWIPRQDVTGIDLRPALIKEFVLIPEEELDAPEKWGQSFGSYHLEPNLFV